MAKRKCFACDGTGQMCDTCGESLAACQCDELDAAGSSSECEECEGTGVAALDRDGTEPKK